MPEKIVQIVHVYMLNKHAHVLHMLLLRVCGYSDEQTADVEVNCAFYPRKADNIPQVQQTGR